MKVNDMDSNITVFGENHTKYDEVMRIREDILSLNPEVILHELYWEDNEFYKKYNINCIPLEDDFTDKSFYNRELSMIKHLLKAMKKYKNICIVVGDTHLRTKKVYDLDLSVFREFLDKIGSEIIRSDYKEVE